MPASPEPCGPFVVIIGNQSSGSSAIAGMAYHLGLYMGTRLGGRYGGNPDKKCGFEDKTIMRLVFRNCKYVRGIIGDKDRIFTALADRIDQLQKEARAKSIAIAGVKLPRLVAFGDMFHEILGDGLHVICCDRPLEDSIKSLHRLRPKLKESRVREIQGWFQENKEHFLSLVHPSQVLHVAYYDVLNDPLTEAGRINRFLPGIANHVQIEKAVKYIRPKLRHFGE